MKYRKNPELWNTGVRRNLKRAKKSPPSDKSDNLSLQIRSIESIESPSKEETDEIPELSKLVWSCLRSYSSSICKISVTGRGEAHGFLIADRWVVTNCHVISSEEEAILSKFEFIVNGQVKQYSADLSK